MIMNRAGKMTFMVAVSAVFLLIFSGLAFASPDYAQDDLSRDESGVIYYDEEIDPTNDGVGEIEFELRDGDGDGIDDDVYFYIESSWDVRDVDFYYDEDTDYALELVEDHIWKVETDHAQSDFDGTYISIWAESTEEGEFDLYFGKEESRDIVRSLFRGSEYGGEITMEVVGRGDAEVYELEGPDTPVKAGRSYEITATVYEYENNGLGPEVRDAEVTFYEREEGERSWQEIGTEETDRRGEAEIRVTNDYKGSYEYTAEVGEAEKEYDEARAVVAASDPHELEALEDELNTEQREEKIYFQMTDRYGNINKDIEHGVEHYENYRRTRIDDFDYTERLEITVEDPDGQTEVYENGDIEYCDDEKAMYTEIDFDEYGYWDVEGRVTGTGITALTEVNVMEFGEIEDIELELDNQVMRNFEDGDGTHDFEYYEDDEATVILIDEDGVRMEYDTGDRDVLFSSSNTRVASISSATGELTPKRTGETEIEAYHQGAELEASQMLYLSNEPVEIEVEEDIEEGELEGEIKMTMLDDEGIRALPGEFETYREDGTDYAEEFVEEGEYDLVISEGLETEDVEDFEEGRASFSVEADDYDYYTIRVYTDFGLSRTFDIEFTEVEEEPEEPEEKEMTLTIDEMDYTINGELGTFRDVAPFIREERTYLPLRAITENFGADVTYESEDDSITVELEDQDRVGIFYLDSDEFYVDGVRRSMDVKPYLDEEENRSYLPIRYLGEELLDADVEWDEENRTVTIKY